MKKSWPNVPLGEVLRERQEAPSAEALASGEIRIVSKIGFNNGTIQLRADGETKTGMILIRPGDLVVSGINAAKGAIAIYDADNTEPIAATIHYGAYIPNKDRVDVRFLWWLLRSRTFRELLFEYVPGGIKTELKAKRLLPVPVPLPLLEEQRRIVAQIEALAVQIAAARSLREQAVEEVSGLLQAKVRQISERLIPCTRPLGSAIQSCRNGITRRPFGSEEGPIVLRLADVSGGSINLSTPRRGALTAQEIDGYSLAAGDLLTVRVNGSRSIVGRIIPFRGAPESVCFNDHLIRIRIDTSVVEPEFVAHMASGPHARAYIEGAAITTAGQLTVNQGMIAQMPIPFPILSEQRRIVAYLDGLQAQVDALKRLQAETAAELAALLPSILDRAFKGQL